MILRLIFILAVLMSVAALFTGSTESLVLCLLAAGLAGWGMKR